MAYTLGQLIKAIHEDGISHLNIHDVVSTLNKAQQRIEELEEENSALNAALRRTTVDRQQDG
jgi:hypothetical protein